MHRRALGLLPDRLGDVLGGQVDAQATQRRWLEGLAADHGRAHEGWHEVADADAVTLPLQIKCLGQPAHGELGGRIAGHVRRAIQPGGRAHVDHLGIGGGLEVAEGQVRQLQQAQHIDVEDAHMLVQADLLELAEAQHAGAVEQQAQLALVLAAEIRQRLADRRPVGHVQCHEPGVAELGGQARQRLGIDIEQADLPATLMKQPRGGGTDAGRGTADQNIVHVTLPVP